MKTAYRQIERSLQRREGQRSREERLERERKRAADAQLHASYLNEQLDLLDGAFRSRRASLRVRSSRTNGGLELQWDNSMSGGALIGIGVVAALMVVGVVVFWGSVIAAFAIVGCISLLALAVLSVAKPRKMSALSISVGNDLVVDLLGAMRTGDSEAVSRRVTAILRRQPETKVSTGPSLIRQWRSGVRRGA